MNRFELPRNNGQAVVRYLDGDFQIIANGTHVVCAVTGRTIPIDELKYWSVERQEAYVDAQASLDRHLQVTGQG
ncbi:DUF2093 domain-containing protein [Siculibacillus lacustris]|uniref:DUF2093 domain-containing protein n=1 Tax=Siculibacillus lacustris TaxID=1549641 RepID=A0A4Q9VIM6_9HYPH|nr:DUF2093 domain-containing protein [Siculibacillus lacustris]TBW34979.1 DUF2093 domain-containing protein [Siculibacillus lacustris]